MSEIIPILELVPVNSPECTGCYFYKNEKCTDLVDGEAFSCTGNFSLYNIWKKVTK